MKAYHILMFLLLFNLVFWALTAGLGIFNVYDVKSPDAFNLSEEVDDPTRIGMGLLSVLSLFNNPLADILVLSVTLMGLAMTGWVTAQQAPQGVIYGLFGWFFWSSFKNTLTVLWSIAGGNLGVTIVLVIFAMIVGVVFIVGLFQIVTGGWKAHE